MHSVGDGLLAHPIDLPPPSSTPEYFDPMDWVDVSIDAPEGSRAAQAEFWAATLGWPLSAPWPGLPEFASFVPPDGDSYVHLQTLGSPSDKAGVHLDFEVPDVGQATEWLTQLGATAGKVGDRWQPMSSPGGLPFCVVPYDRAKRRPPAVRQAHGRLTRLVQVSIDAPADDIDREVEFWRAATEWRWVPRNRPDFVGKLFSDGLAPIQLLLQRLERGSPETATRAHLDLGSEDIEVEAARLASLGATVRGSGDGWITLSDPAGMLFCVTENSPD